jgi:WD40 repeat protein
MEILSLPCHAESFRSIGNVSFSPDGRALASAGSEGVLVWNAETGRRTFTLRGHTHFVYGVSFSPDGRYLASSSEDRTVRIWDTQSGEETCTLKGHTDRVESVCFSPEGRRLASASADGTVKVWDAHAGQEPRTFQVRAKILCFSPDGQRLAGIPHANVSTAKIWDVSTGQEVVCLEKHSSLRLTSVCFSPDGSQLTSGYDDGSVRIWDAQTGRLIRSLEGFADGASLLCFSVDGRRLAAASDAGMVKVWDAQTGRAALSLEGPAGGISSFRFSRDGARLAVAGGEGVKVWDAQTGQRTPVFSGHSGPVFSVDFSPDGRCLAGAGSAAIWILDAHTGQEILTIPTGARSSICFSPDGTRLASAAGDTVKLWDTHSGQETLSFKGPGRLVISVAFSLDGQRLTSASVDGTVKVWDITAWSPEAQIEGEAAGVVRFFADDLLLQADVLTALRADRTIREAVRERALALAGRHRDDPDRLHAASWAIVSRPGASAEQYGRALKWAQAICRLRPDVGRYLRTLGMAQYRAGKLPEALQTLQRSDRLNCGGPYQSHLPDLAFLAMACEQSGMKNQARAHLDQLRQALAQPRWANDQECQRLLREAAALVQGTNREVPSDTLVGSRVSGTR